MEPQLGARAAAAPRRKTPPMTHPPRVIAHRGASAQHRENAPAAWQAALAAGADVIEADIRMTADHRLVIGHDADLSRLTGEPLVIAETPFARLQSRAAEGAPAAPPLPLLLASVPATQPLLFDIKDESPVALALLVEAALASGRDALIMGVHRVESLHRLRALGWPGAVLGLLTDMGETAAFFDAGGSCLRLWEAEALARPGALSALVAAGRDVWITTGNCDGRAVGDHAEASLRALAAMGATGFLVNDPGACRAALQGVRA